MRQTQRPERAQRPELITTLDDDLTRMETPARGEDRASQDDRSHGFEGFFTSNYERLSKTMYIITRNQEVAKDLAQESMVRVYERWDAISASRNPSGYLFRVAVNLNRRALRRRILGSRLANRLEVGPSPPPDPHAAAEVMAAIGHLSRAEREALALVGWLGYSAAGPLPSFLDCSAIR
jgi:DNA-directed RNA polymerase specialized sigma24 family protein